MSVERARVLVSGGSYRVVETVEADGELWEEYRTTPFVVEVGAAESYVGGVLSEEEVGAAAFSPIGGSPGLPEACFRTLGGALRYLAELEHAERTVKPEAWEEMFWRITERATERP